MTKYDLIVTGKAIDYIRLECTHVLKALHDYDKSFSNFELEYAKCCCERLYGMINFALRTQQISFKEWEFYFHIYNKLNEMI